MKQMDLPSPARFTHDIEGGADSGRLAGLRWANAKKPPLLFCHATGFCASAYRQMLAPLQQSFDVFALDMRGHGRTTLPTDPGQLTSWRSYAQDIGVFLNDQDRSNWTLAGHSMGAVAVTMAARGRADVAAVKLLEPVAVPSWLSALAHTPVWPILARRIPMVRAAARRRSAWPSADMVQASYGRKALFKHWAPGVLEDYLEDGLSRASDGVVLSCAPAWEAATFGAQANPFWAALAEARSSVAVFAGSQRRSTVSSAARRKLKRLGAQLEVDRMAGHLAPMEKPAVAAAFIRGDLCD